MVIGYWDPMKVCGNNDARMSAKVIAITEHPDYPVLTNAMNSLGPHDWVQVMSPGHVSNGMRQFQDYILVPGRVKEMSTIEAVAAAHTLAYAAMKQKYPDMIDCMIAPK